MWCRADAGLQGCAEEEAGSRAPERGLGRSQQVSGPRQGMGFRAALWGL